MKNIFIINIVTKKLSWRYTSVLESFIKNEKGVTRFPLVVIPAGSFNEAKFAFHKLSQQYLPVPLTDLFIKPNLHLYIRTASKKVQK